MMKRLTAILCVLLFSLVTNAAFAADNTWRDPSVSAEEWARIKVVDIIIENENDEFLQKAFAYEAARIGEDKLDNISFREGYHEDAPPNAHVGIYIKRFEKKYFWFEAHSSTYEQQYTTTNTYTDYHGNLRTKYTTHIQTEILDHPPRYSPHSYVQIGIGVFLPGHQQVVYFYEAIEDDHEKSPISIYRDAIEDFYKKWKKEMKK